MPVTSMHSPHNFNNPLHRPMTGILFSPLHRWDNWSAKMLHCSRFHKQYAVELKFQNSYTGPTLYTHNHHSELVKESWHVKIWNIIFLWMKRKYDELTHISKIYLNPFLRKLRLRLPFSSLQDPLLFSSVSDPSPQSPPCSMRGDFSRPEVTPTRVS